MNARGFNLDRRIVMLGAVILVGAGFSATALRYETEALSKNTFIVRDRWTGGLSFCIKSKCNTVDPRPEFRRVPDETFHAPLPTAKQDGGEDWSRLSDDEFLKAALEASERTNTTTAVRAD